MNTQDRYQELSRELDTDRCIEAAKKATGLSRFDSDRFYEPLRKLLDCAAREVDFHPQGLIDFKNYIVHALVNRLRMQQDYERHPEILDEDISDPIIIIGLGRCGSTKLHKVFSAPDDVQKTLFWRMFNPARFPDAKPGQPDPRIAAAGSCEMVSEDKPVLDAAHHMEEGEVEEEWMLNFLTFDDWGLAYKVPVPSYFDWLMTRPRSASIENYREVKRMLQYLQWQDGGKRGRPWVLKSVGHAAYMDALMECYPNATLVQAHRDLLSTIPSHAKLLSGIWSIYSNPLDPHFIGQEMQRMMAAVCARFLEARDRLGLNDRILDVDYEQVRTDPMSIVKEVYRRAGRALSPESEQKMAAWHATNEQGAFGKHVYSLEEFGLSEAGINKAFAEYIRRFIKR